MTGYHITIGCISGYASPRLDSTQAWNILKTAAQRLAADPDRIAAEALTFGAPAAADGADIAAWAALYHNPAAAALTILDTDPVTGDPAQQIMLLASGDGPGRALKEHLHRAFCRLLLADMHRQGLELTMTVC